MVVEGHWVVYCTKSCCIVEVTFFFRDTLFPQKAL
jgi:hypothetical protein